MIHRAFQHKLDSRSETIWLTIYADLITNLALVFLALFGLEVMGEDAMAKAVQSMKLTEIYHVKDLGFEFTDLGPILREKFKDIPEVAVEEGPGVVRIEFGEKFLFESGQAVPKASATQTLLRVANLLQLVPHTIVVEGHTDSLPLKGRSRYRDNWELSLARSMAVVDVLSQEGGIKPLQLAAAAYGDSRPRASNLTPTGRQMNRRVEIALFRDFRSDPSNHVQTVKPSLPAVKTFINLKGIK